MATDNDSSRQVTDIGSDTTNISERDTRQQTDISGNVTQYYSDLQTTMTPEEYDAWTAYDTSYQEALEEDKGLLSQYQSEYDTAMAEYESAKSEVPTLTEAVDKSWKTHQGELHKVSIGTYRKSVSKAWAERNLDPSEYTLIADGEDREGDTTYRDVVNLKKPYVETKETFYLPKSAVDKINSELSAAEGSMYYGYLSPDHLVIDTKYSTGKPLSPSKSAYGSLKEALEGASETYKADYYASASESLSPELAEARSTLTTAYTDLMDYKKELDAAQSRVDSIENRRQQQLDLWADEYQSRVDTLRGMYGTTD